MKNSQSFFGGAYGMTIIGAAFYFVEHTSGFWNIVLAILKAMVWPALMIYHVLGMLGM